MEKYKNGNYTVSIDLSDGTKIRTAEEDEFVPAFAESMDINITNKCKVGCTYCYQGCTKDGQHAPLRELCMLEPKEETIDRVLEIIDETIRAASLSGIYRNLTVLGLLLEVKDGVLALRGGEDK